MGDGSVVIAVLVPCADRLVDTGVCYYAVVAYCVGDNRVKGISCGASQSGFELAE